MKILTEYLQVLVIESLLLLCMGCGMSSKDPIPIEGSEGA